MQAFLVYGWIGGAAYVALVMVTLAMGFRSSLLPAPWQTYLIAAYATFVGEAFEGFIVDTDHWRLLPHSRPGLGPDGGEYQSATQRALSANRFKSTDIQGPTRKDSTPGGSSVTGEYIAETRKRARATQTSTKGKARPAGL